MTYGGPMGDVAPLHGSVNGPKRFVPLGWLTTATLVALEPMSPAAAPTHTSNGQRSDGSVGEL